MATDIGSLNAFITADNTALEMAARDSFRTMKRLEGQLAASTKRIASGFSTVGKALTVGVTLPVIAAGTAMLKSASDAEETAQKFGVVFSTVSNEANLMAETLRNDFGLARTEARMLLSDTADLLSGFGFTQKAALDLSVQVNTLAVDLASFTNIEGGSERASKALTKALLGERESVKELGIAILESDVKARVLLMSQQGLTFETERQAKAYATLQIALEQSKNAIGDFERSQESNANQTRIFWARLRDVGETLGTALLPTMTKVVSKGTELLDAFMLLNPETQSLAVQMALVAGLAGPAAIGISGLFNAGTLLIPVAGQLAGILALFASPLGAIGAGVLIATAGLIKMVGPVDAMAVGWEALEQAQSFWAEQFGPSVDFVVKKTKDLRIMVRAADIIGKAWVGLRTIYSLFSAGIGIVIRDVANGFAVMIGAVQKAAGFLGITLPGGAEKAKKAFLSLSDVGKDFAQTNIEVAADTAAEWDNAFESLKGTTATFTAATKDAFVAVRNVGSEILDTLLSESDDKGARIKSILDELKDTVINITAKVSVEGVDAVTVPAAAAAAPVEAFDPLAGRKAATDAIIAEAQRQGESEIEQGKLTAESLAGINAFRLQTILEQEKEAGILRIESQRAFKADHIALSQSLADGFADSIGRIVADGKSFADEMKNLWKSIFGQLISLEVKWVIASIAASVKRVAAKTVETQAVVVLDETQVIANSAAAAPHPFLIPVFVAIGVAALAAALSGGGGGGGDVATPTTATNREVPGPPRQEAGAGGAGEDRTLSRLVVEVNLAEAQGHEPIMSWVTTQAHNGIGDGSGRTLALNEA